MAKNAKKNRRDPIGKRARGAESRRPTRRTAELRAVAAQLAEIKGQMRAEGKCSGCEAVCTACPNVALTL